MMLRSSDLRGLQRLSDFCSVIAVAHDSMEKPEHVHQVEPKSAVEALGIEVFGHGGVMPFHHHQPATPETFHGYVPVRCSCRELPMLHATRSGSGRILATRFRGGTPSSAA